MAFTSYTSWKAVPEQSKEHHGLMGSVLSPPELLVLPTTYAEMCLLCVYTCIPVCSNEVNSDVQ